MPNYSSDFQFMAEKPFRMTRPQSRTCVLRTADISLNAKLESADKAKRRNMQRATQTDTEKNHIILDT
jgi:hypothetical protein